MISMPYKDMPEGSPMAAGVWHSISKCLDAAEVNLSATLVAAHSSLLLMRS